MRDPTGGFLSLGNSPEILSMSHSPQKKKNTPASLRRSDSIHISFPPNLRSLRSPRLTRELDSTRLDSTAPQQMLHLRGLEEVPAHVQPPNSEFASRRSLLGFWLLGGFAWLVGFLWDVGLGCGFRVFVSTSFEFPWGRIGSSNPDPPWKGIGLKGRHRDAIHSGVPPF